MREVLLDLGDDPHAESLSGVAPVGGHLFVAPDEGAAVVRLTRRHDGSFGEPRVFPLVDLVSLPGEDDDEIDLEALDVADGYLHLLGSHSAKRKKADAGTPVDKVAKRLKKVTPERSRRLLARVPLVSDDDGPRPVAADGHLAPRPDVTVSGATVAVDVAGDACGTARSRAQVPVGLIPGSSRCPLSTEMFWPVTFAARSEFR